jgi:hypothetical protein
MLVGGARLKLDEEVVELKAWDAIRVALETARGFEAGPEGTEYTAFGAPNTENRDAEPAPNWWTD